MQKLFQNTVVRWILYLILFAVGYEAFKFYPTYTTHLMVGCFFIYFVIRFIKADKKGSLIGPAVLSLAWLLILPYKDLYMTVYNSFKIQSYKLNLLITGGAAAGIVIVVFFLTWGLLYSLKKDSSSLCATEKITLKNIGIYSIFPMISFGLTWIRDYPAKLTPDSYEQLAQIHGKIPYSDIHSIGHTLFSGLIMKIWDSPASVIIFHVLAMSITVGFALSYFRSKGFSQNTLMLVSIFFGCFSPSRYIITFFWKDIPYSIAIVLITILLMIYMDKKERVGSAYLIIGGLAAAGTFLFRHNGLVVYVILVPLFIYLMFKFSKKKYIVPLCISILIIMGVRLYAFDYLHTKPNDHGAKYGIFAKAVVSVVANNGKLTEEERRQIESIVPPDIIKERYAWGQGGGLMWLYGNKSHPKYFYNAAIYKNHKEIMNLFFKLYPKNIKIMTWDILGSQSLIWQFRTYYLDKNIPYMYLLAVCILVLWRGNKRFMIPFLPVFLSVLSIAISNTTYEPRYTYPTIAAFPFLILFSFLVMRSQGKQKEGNGCLM
ncbi:MAG: hypothetical protein N2645_23955 [Clostridia bacterium]|nr:hypothetical protein [Clostridia bacterium]